MRRKLLASAIGAVLLAGAGTAQADPAAPAPQSGGDRTFLTLEGIAALPLAGGEMAQIRGADHIPLLVFLDSAIPRVVSFPPDPIDALDVLDEVNIHPPDPV